MDDERIRQRLLARAREIRALAEGSGTDGAVVDLDQQRVGRLSRMDALQAQAMAGATRQRRESELGRIRAALERLDLNEFGYCTECGEQIPPGRLEIDPSVARCVDCAQGRS